MDLGNLHLTTQVYGNELWRWLVAFVGGCLLWLAAAAAKGLLARIGHRWVRAEQHDWGRIVMRLLAGTRSWFLLSVALSLTTRFVELPERADVVLRVVLVVPLWLQVGLWARVVLQHVVERVLFDPDDEDPARKTSAVALNALGHLVIWSVVLLGALENLGVDVTALVAGFGIGGVAVALAAQRVLGDLFASLSIVLDRPFEVGDFIIVGDFLGTVERIGLKTTRVRSLGGEQLVFGNNDLLDSRIRNYKRMQERRVAFTVGVTYQTEHEKLRKVPKMLREIIESIQKARFDRAHFKAFEDWSLSFEIVYYVLTSDYNEYMDVQQKINLEIARRFQEEEIEFAYPTRTVHLTPVDALEVPMHEN